MADASQGTQEQSKTALPGFLNPWILLIGGVFSVLGTIWVGVDFFNPIKDLDLTVVMEDRAEFSLPEQANTLPKLALTYDGQPVQKIVLLRLKVINTGNRAIEPPDDSQTNEWILTLRSLNKEPLVRVGELIKPNSVHAIPESGPGPDEIRLKLRVLNRNESITMQVAVIGSGALIPIIAENPEPRVPDLNVAIALDSVTKRIRDAFFLPLWVISIVLFVGWWIADMYRGRKATFTGPSSWKTLTMGIFGILIIIVFSTVVALGASWLLSWIVYLVAFR